MTALRCFALALLLLLFPAVEAAAQGSHVEPNSLVRTTIAGVRREFTLVELRPDSIVLSDGAQQQSRLALSDLDSLHVSAGHRTGGFARFIRGAGKGLLLLGGVGALLGLMDGDDSPGFLSQRAEDKAMIGFVFLGGLGAVIGGLIGLAGDDQRWVPVPIR